jgi:hypothetical protein
MAFQQVHKGKTFNPGTQFPEYCEFENCTFYASCKFKKGSIFKNCRFLKCCPPFYRNPNSEVKEAILENCYLEYITVDKDSLVVNCKKGARAVIQAKENPAPQQVGNSEDFCLCYCAQPTPCQSGVSVAPVQSGKPEAKNMLNDCNEPCGTKTGFSTN